MPETTRNAALRARELEIEAKRKDLERRKMNRFTWVGGCGYGSETWSKNIPCRVTRSLICWIFAFVSLSLTLYSALVGQEGCYSSSIRGKDPWNGRGSYHVKKRRRKDECGKRRRAVVRFATFRPFEPFDRPPVFSYFAQNFFSFHFLKHKLLCIV